LILLVILGCQVSNVKASVKINVSENDHLEKFDISNLSKLDTPREENTKPGEDRISSYLLLAICRSFKTYEQDFYFHIKYKNADTNNRYRDYLLRIPKEEAKQVDCSNARETKKIELAESYIYITRSLGWIYVKPLDGFFKANPKILGGANNNLAAFIVDIYVGNKPALISDSNSTHAEIFGLTIGVTEFQEAVNKYGSNKSDISNVTNGRRVRFDKNRISFADLLAATAIFDDKNKLVYVHAAISQYAGGSPGGKKNFQKIYEILKKKYRLIDEDQRFRSRIKYANFISGDTHIRLELDSFKFGGPVNLMYYNDFFLEKATALRKSQKLKRQEKEKKKNKNMESQL
jgi:hypothetical protein